MIEPALRRVGQLILESVKPYGSRAAFDQYPTPLAFARAALDVLPRDFAPRYVLDPGAGSGAWGIALKDKYPDAKLHGVEIQTLPACPAYDVWTHADYLAAPRFWPWRYDLVLGNPPYGLNAANKRDDMIAERFVRKAIEDVRFGGYVLFLLLGSFRESATRARSLWRELPPLREYDLVQRVSFSGDNRTDARSYCLYLWQKGAAFALDPYTGFPVVTRSWISWR